MEQVSEEKRPTPAPSRLGRLFSKRNIIIAAFIVLILDIALTHYFFNSRHRRLFRASAIRAASEAGTLTTLGELTAFEWKNASIEPLERGGRFWFCTYDSRTYLFDYIFSFADGEIVTEADASATYTPDSAFVLTKDGKTVRMRPAK